MTQYLVYDVFTDTVFGGNQLAVFPDARELPENKLQAIAAEFNFSEVTFVYPPANPDHSAKVRIFTPTSHLCSAGIIWAAGPCPCGPRLRAFRERH